MLQKIASIPLIDGDIEIHQPEDISAIVNFGPNGDDFIAIGSDESQDRIQILKKTPSGGYAVLRDIVLSDSEEDEELDIEGMSIDGDTLYVIGSHSLRRKKVKSDKTYNQNRKRLFTVVQEDRKAQIFKLVVDINSGEVQEPIESSDRHQSALEADDLLGRFTQIPSKENGVDIEGLAIQGDELYLGFRGPVLRGNFVPVMVSRFDDPDTYELRFVDLQGRGIRDIVSTSNGFLLIAGPVGDGSEPYEVFFWDGSDLVPGSDRPVSPSQLYSLGTITPPDGAKAEGITVLEESPAGYKLMIAFDGVTTGQVEIWQATREE